ncbi:MAG: DUF523 domain-containing protein [Eubacteriales bacterium]|nr:DUF523 domain-containing protein [Eubacteriales bacterium]
MKIMVSACLLGENCKYSGGNNRNQAVLDSIEGHEVIAVCPEVMGGLPVPRIPCEVKNGVVVNKEGKSCDQEFRLGAEKALKIAKEEQIDLAILKSRSPSCGIGQIYDGTFSGTLISDDGIFVSLMKEEGYRILTEEEIQEKVMKLK